MHWNLVAPELIQQAVRRDEGMLADMGPFVAVTSPHTGRSPNDKFVVKDPEVAEDVWWGKVNQPISPEHFDALLADVRKHLDASTRSRSCRICGPARIRRTGSPCAS